MSAITTAVLALVPLGGRVLYTDPVYGGTYLRFTVSEVRASAGRVDRAAHCSHRAIPALLSLAQILQITSTAKQNLTLCFVK